jgi:transcription elongation GreA/GreB family factor
MEVSRVEAEKVQLQERIAQLQIILKETRSKGGDDQENGDHDDKAKDDGVCEKKCKELTHKLRNV